MARVSGRAIPPAEISPLEFFERWVPDAVNHDAERRARIADLRARIQFQLDGPDGGAYWLHVEDGRVVGAAGVAEAPDLVLHLDVGTWRRLNAGEISAPHALLTGALRFRGSIYLALRLHFILG
jgi:putative sterol carrier protein